jgi:hypothetical protein
VTDAACVGCGITTMSGIASRLGGAHRMPGCNDHAKTFTAHEPLNLLIGSTDAFIITVSSARDVWMLGRRVCRNILSTMHSCTPCNLRFGQL